jgi:murein DD-endopeptidase MepM/ murein hydrolase activator NlpD
MSDRVRVVRVARAMAASVAFMALPMVVFTPSASPDGLRAAERWGAGASEVRQGPIDARLAQAESVQAEREQAESVQADSEQRTERPFGLPFAEPAGPDTWLLGQPYGNTTSAYRRRSSTYAAGQGLHFGVDFGAPCGTEIVAAASGVAFASDAMHFGSAPHNLMIDHPDLGYATFYGHLLERPRLQPGETVRRGQVVALSGDPGGNCDSRPHLHFEIRDLRHVRKYNPVVLVEADWDDLALVGSYARTFQRDLGNPRRWQHLDDQPETVIAGPLLNDFANPWPPDSN